MPAAKKPAGTGLVAQLTSMAKKVQVSNIVTLPRYYRTLDLLLTQVGTNSTQQVLWHLSAMYLIRSATKESTCRVLQIALYRTAQNDEQLYVMLLRYTR